MKIENGTTLPTIDGEMDGEVVDITAATRGSWTALLLYRGHW